MRLKQVIKTPEGIFEFQGELNQAEHDLIVEAGVNWLLGQGIIPFKAFKDEIDKVSYVKPPENSQPS